MRCPFCHKPDSRVVDSRETDEGATTRRRRSCPACGRRFTTVEETVLAVVKRSGVSEPFNRAKVVAGVQRACQGRPVDEHQLALLAQRVEDAVRSTGSAEIPSHEVGLAILGPLRELDEVAYLRFASVYRNFSSVADFEKEIAELRAGSTGAAGPPHVAPGTAGAPSGTAGDEGSAGTTGAPSASGTTGAPPTPDRRPADGSGATGPGGVAGT